MDQNRNIKKALFAQTERFVTRVGLGGEGVLRTHGQTENARNVIREALDAGITYFDSARVYADSELYYGSIWGRHPEKREGIFQASKSASRDRIGALRDLEETLDRTQTEVLDLWQIHDVRTEQDFEMIGGPGGALEAFLEAKSSGKVRQIGVTGHHDPAILTRAVSQWPVDSVMMPVNPVEQYIGGFLTSTLPAAREKGMAIIAMKVLGASQYIFPDWGISAALLIRFALAKGVTVAIVGCSSPGEARILADTARQDPVLTPDEQNRIEKVFKPYAKRLAFYRGVL